MKKILNVISSARGGASVSIQLADSIIGKLQQRYPGSTVITRNLVTDPYPHLEESHLNAFFAPADASPGTADAARHSDQAIREVQEADIIVIGVPIYNFHIPSALKAWIDHLVRAHKTFAYTDGFPEGLVKNKKVYLALASGGVFSEGPMQPHDYAVPYLRFILGFIGIKDISVFRAEGLSIPGVREIALQKGIESVTV
ncbi:MAG: NAD(P)H-dependent oxidoreductase [Bacteroidetes bacterium]|nr:NAD(P)H-dependent oxidoreductase [Bacteroidota bacterium]